MSREFEIVREFETEASPEEVWDAFTTGTAGWLWPEPEPKDDATTTVWDPPRHFVSRVETPGATEFQSLNQLDRLIEPREGGGSRVRYVHSGIFVDGWEDQYDGADKHTGFYLHTLRQYLAHFAGRPAAFTTVNAPGGFGAPGALATVTRGIGLPDDAAEGATVRVEPPGAAEPVEAVVDYRDTYFVGLRTPDAMYRIFGRNHFGGPVGVSVHDFATGADADATEAAWRARLAELLPAS